MLSTAPDETRGLRVWARADSKCVLFVCWASAGRRGRDTGTRAEIAPPTGVLGEPLVTRLCQVQERKTSTDVVRAYIFTRWFTAAFLCKAVREEHKRRKEHAAS